MRIHISLSIFIVIIILCGYLNAEIPPVAQCNHQYKRGIYKTVEEFLENSPSENPEFFLKESGNNLKASKLKYVNEKGKTRTYRKQLWGFCDGTNIYIKFSGTFCLVNIYPLYSHFTFQGKVHFGGGPVMGASGVVVGFTPSIPVEYENDYAIDMKSGEIRKLSNITLSKIIEDDEELLQRFKNERGKREKRVQYLIEYNERNASRNNTEKEKNIDK